MTTRVIGVLSIMVLIAFTSCKSNSEKEDISEISSSISSGLIFTKTDDLNDAAEDFKSYVDTDGTLTISIAINHTQNAKDVGLDLDINEVYYIDNPRYSIPLIEENPLMALEFPIRIGFYEVTDKKLVVARSEDYFLKRYGLNNSAALRSVGTLSETFLKQSSKAAYTQDSPIDSLDNNGIISLESSMGHQQTVESIQKAIENNEDFTLFESKNFTEEAVTVGKTINPLHLFIFGNPKVGTKLMQQNPNFSVDLPLKVLVEEPVDGEVLVHFQDMSYTAQLHSEKFEDELPSKITQNLKQMLNKLIATRDTEND
mgnify:CR=1 FL=1